ncbi:UDP-N-acetylenolpyruvoylglucosamine reductase MurB [Rubripirellula obstinata]|uniref:UDP-N-acetylenolpyruvoylglucosamine reductase n=1 Tax=Rubripirellula obstinata TaxID=406547 RepID=A0A5B1CN46_9BACT|nr:UDP-N-acetylmuramate dehydrogenase [Rubripirellula obstinata]KAA1261000.1 UDP-N-acetylenolpyruvoylglucosamine reductase MurB [Rubripirellula obstinata]
MATSTMRDSLKQLARRSIGETSFDAPLRNHSWWGIGGPADLLVQPTSLEQLCTLIKSLHEFQLPHLFIGDGSNLLFDDVGVRGVVVKLGRNFSSYEISGRKITAQSGVFVPRLIRNIGRAGLTGLEHAIGIPGTLGGLVLMNGGSLRQGIGTHVQQVHAINSMGEMIRFDRDSCQFSYRKSALQNAGLVIARVDLQCSTGDPVRIQQRMRDILRSRRKKFPRRHPNCGSVFLSDPKNYDQFGPPGAIIERCGLKTLRIGDAMIPQQHANFIVNLGRASSADVLSLVRTVRQDVFDKTGFLLNCEVRYVQPDGQQVPAHEACDDLQLT